MQNFQPVVAFEDLQSDSVDVPVWSSLFSQKSFHRFLSKSAESGVSETRVGCNPANYRDETRCMLASVQPFCCDLNEIEGNESLYCFEASGSVLGCED